MKKEKLSLMEYICESKKRKIKDDTNLGKKESETKENG